MRWSLVALLLVGCQQEEPDEGIAVGNPGLTSVSMAISDSVTLTSVAGTLRRARFAGAECGGVDVERSLDLPVDLAVEPAEFAFPGGTWCGLILDFEGALAFEGTWERGARSGGVLGSPSIGSISLGAVDGVLDVDDDSELAFELAAPGWLELLVDPLEDGELLQDDDTHALHAWTVEAVVDDSGLFDDGDGDGLVTEAERAVGAVATAMEVRFEPLAAYGTTADSEASAMSCSTGGRGLPLLLLLVARRRRGGASRA